MIPVAVLAVSNRAVRTGTDRKGEWMYELKTSDAGVEDPEGISSGEHGVEMLWDFAGACVTGHGGNILYADLCAFWNSDRSVE